MIRALKNTRNTVGGRVSVVSTIRETQTLLVSMMPTIKSKKKKDTLKGSQVSTNNNDDDESIDGEE